MNMVTGKEQLETRLDTIGKYRKKYRRHFTTLKNSVAEFPSFYASVQHLLPAYVYQIPP